MERSSSITHFYNSHLNKQINQLWAWLPNVFEPEPLSKSLEDIGFQYWHEKQPDNTIGNEFCVEMRGDFEWHWNDAQCHLLNGYICETKMKLNQGME